MCVHVQMMNAVGENVDKSLMPDEVPEQDDQTEELPTKTSQIESSIDKQKYKSWWKKIVGSEQCKNVKVKLTSPFSQLVAQRSFYKNDLKSRDLKKKKELKGSYLQQVGFFCRDLNCLVTVQK